MFARRLLNLPESSLLHAGFETVTCDDGIASGSKRRGQRLLGSLSLFRYLLPLLILFLLGERQVDADASRWASTGRFGGDVPTLASDPSNSATIYAGTSGGGLFKSTNGGASWSVANAGLSHFTVNSVAIDPSNSATL